MQLTRSGRFEKNLTVRQSLVNGDVRPDLVGDAGLRPASWTAVPKACFPPGLIGRWPHVRPFKFPHVNLSHSLLA